MAVGKTIFGFSLLSFWPSYDWEQNMRTTMKLRVFAARALFGAVVLLIAQNVVAQDTVERSAVAIVVHKDADVDNLSLAELQSVFLAEQQFWPDRTRIILLVRAPKSDERDFVLNSIYEMTEAQFRQYWIAKMFRAEVPRGPKIVFSTDMTLDLVIAIPGSISFMRADEVTDDVKVIKVDGKLPSETGYPLQ
jgi:ABC-type phosphate transport system substrate-binding protein